MAHQQLREDLSVYGSAPPVHQSYLSSAYYDPNSRTAFDELDEQKVKSEAEHKEDEDEEDYYRRQQQDYEEKSRYGERERDTERDRDRAKTPSASPPRSSPPLKTSNLLQQQQQPQQPLPQPLAPPPPAPVHPFFSSSFSARSTVPPLHPKLISLKDKPSQERQSAIHKLLQQTSVVSVSSPEYEFSMGSSTASDGEPNTPSVSGKHHAAPTEMSDITFTKENVVTAATIGTSSLTTQITQRERLAHPHQRRHRYAYTPNITGDNKGKMHVTVYLPVHDLFIQCDVSNALMASSLIRIILQIYRQEHAAHLHPLLLDTHHNYQLYICDENGCVDDDCPGLDPHCQLGTTASCFFALQHKEPHNASAYTQNYQSSQAPPLPRVPPKKRPSLSAMSSASVASEVYSDESREARTREHEHADGDYGDDTDRSLHHEQMPQHRSSAFEVESGGAHFMEQRSPWWSTFICCAEQFNPAANDLSHRRSSSAAVLTSPMSPAERLKQKFTSFKTKFNTPKDHTTTSSSGDVVAEQER